ncbi:hypothetical protein BDZ97DRAFT_1933659 [Flammula alnicola]|nr:hypothetical protein BDZ97DRAFT_1933659 [Flammula alnicola]
MTSGTSGIHNEDADSELPDLVDVEDCEDDDRHELEAMGLSNAQLTDNAVKPKHARTQADNPLAMWVPYIDIYVNELLRLEGRGDLVSQSQCAGIGKVLGFV